MLMNFKKYAYQDFKRFTMLNNFNLCMSIIDNLLGFGVLIYLLELLFEITYLLVNLLALQSLLYVV